MLIICIWFAFTVLPNELVLAYLNTNAAILSPIINVTLISLSLGAVGEGVSQRYRYPAQFLKCLSPLLSSANPKNYQQLSPLRLGTTSDQHDQNGHQASEELKS